MNPSQITQLAATADVTTADATLKAVILTAGADAASVVVKAGGSSGTTILTLKAAASTTVASGDLHNAYCADGIHATFTGTSPAGTFVYE